MKQVEKLAKKEIQNIKNEDSQSLEKYKLGQLNYYNEHGFDFLLGFSAGYEIGFRTALELAAKKINMNPDFTIYTTDEIYSQLLQIADREVE